MQLPPATLLKSYLAKKKVKVEMHPHHSPDLAPCEFLLLPHKGRDHDVEEEEAKRRSWQGCDNKRPLNSSEVLITFGKVYLQCKTNT